MHLTQAELNRTPGHFVGPSIHPGLFEVAAPPYTPIPNQDSIQRIESTPVTQLPVSHGVVWLHGLEHARRDAFKVFLTQAIKGIREYGQGLATYYRERYVYYRPWIEYAVLINDLPTPSDAETSMVLFLSLVSIKLDGILSRQVMAMTNEQVLEQLHTKLTREIWSDKPRADILATMHWLILKSGGISHVKIQKPPSSLQHIVAELMTQDDAMEPIRGLNIATVLQTLSRCRALSGHHVDMEFIQRVVRQLDHIHILPMAGMPFFLRLDLVPTSELTGFATFTTKVLDSCASINLYANGERLFAIWTYVRITQDDKLRKQLRPHAHYFLAKFGESLISTSNPSQLILDIVAMACMASLFLTPWGTETYRSAPILDFDHMIKAPQHGAYVCLRLHLLSLSRVLAANGNPERELIDIIGICSPPSRGDIVDNYWHDRITHNHTHI
ncbi:alphan-acetylglucosamine transferase [Fusarium mundagurra]|uniref:Alphan-acetylglucosamine transferase n=1 Tax=Fusarium mundagurra TaxID=1567541 RepID=A0A8H6D651_9HYPO|nr:alphan-acetylglucosamine transferase [Fusarium mundagurra]